MLFLVTLGREGREGAYILHLPVLGRDNGGYETSIFLATKEKKEREFLKKRLVVEHGLGFSTEGRILVGWEALSKANGFYIFFSPLCCSLLLVYWTCTVGDGERKNHMEGTFGLACGLCK